MLDRSIIPLMMMVGPLATGPALQAYEYHAAVGWKHQPLAGVVVTLVEDGASPRQATTAEGGTVRFEGLKAETIRIEFAKDGYFTRRRTVMNFTRKDVDDSLDLVRRIPWQIEGIVRIAGAPVAGAKVELVEGGDAPGETRTGADGRFTFGPLHGTEFSLRVSPEGRRGRFLWQANRSQENVHLELDLSREAPLTRHSGE